MKIIYIMLIVILHNLYAFAQNTEYKINELMRSYAETGQFNGTILVKKGGATIYKNAFGLANREWQIYNTIDTKFLIGSIGKPVTALMTLILVKDGLINLDATINTYLTDYTGPGCNKATIHQMLTHTSGIPNHGAIPNLSKKLVRWNYTTQEYLALIKDIPLQFQPGEGFAYSGIAYNLLAIICEKVTGKEFGALLADRIFIPLQMLNTKHDKNLDIDTKRASGYEYHLLEGYMNPSYIEMCHVKGSGGLLSTVEDMAKFADECFCRHTLLDEKMYQKMFTPYWKDWQYYGYGWWIDHRKIGRDSITIVSHGGSTDGYKAYLTRIVEDSVDIIMCQNNYYRTELGVKFDYFITDEIIDIIYGKNYTLPKKSVGKELGNIIGSKGVESAIAAFQSLKENDTYFVNEEELNQLGIELIKNYQRYEDAYKVYEMAIREYPESFLLNYSFGAFLQEQKPDRAMSYLQKCVDLYGKNPANKKFEKEYNKALNLLGSTVR